LGHAWPPCVNRAERNQNALPFAPLLLKIAFRGALTYRTALIVESGARRASMPTSITINVRNLSPNLQNFFFFQQPVYAGAQEVYTNSLYMSALLPYATSGGVLTFTMILQNYAGVQQQVVPPQVGQPSGQMSAIQAIGLTPAQGGPQTNNTTNMVVTPALGLSPPTYTTGPQTGFFRIVVPTYNPVLAAYNAGSAVQTLAGQVILSSFVTALPNTYLDCQPILKFYVQTGTYTPGTVVNFTSSSSTAALCDATLGYSSFSADYNADGTWTVQSFALLKAADGRLRLVAAENAINAAIKNEAGTAVICTGHAASFDHPVVIQNLSDPNALGVFREYQVGPTGGPFMGSACLNLDVNLRTAVFS
jgi:hypothetical protein